jgi:hypothetical protein
MSSFDDSEANAVVSAGEDVWRKRYPSMSTATSEAVELRIISQSREAARGYVSTRAIYAQPFLHPQWKSTPMNSENEGSNRRSEENVDEFSKQNMRRGARGTDYAASSLGAMTMGLESRSSTIGRGVSSRSTSLNTLRTREYVGLGAILSRFGQITGLPCSSQATRNVREQAGQSQKNSECSGATPQSNA